ncbi:hypothetical protein AcV5_000646 [Taiwanofungus camphoratus]|nr:hypothetical protein AcV5_000646 [Antrodia cinnamomea]
MTLPPAKNAVLANVLSKAISVVVLLCLSLSVFAYRRSLTPLYGTAPTDHHFNKVVWAACIIGSFAPIVPILPAVLAAGILLCLMPNTAYWVAVYTGRMGDPIWGPVATHMAVITPVLGLGVAVVKALQVPLPGQQDNAASQQLITLPVAQTTIMTLQELWPAIPHLKAVSDSQIFLQIGTLALAMWAVAPFLLPASIKSSPSSKPALEAVAAPAPAAAPPQSPKTKSRRKKASKSSTSKSSALAPVPIPKLPTAPPVPAPPKPKSSAQFLRLAILPLLPLLITILPAPTLPHPLLAPYTHPSYPLRILSAAHSPYSGVVVVGEALQPNAGETSSGRLHSLRYLRAGHSLLGGVWIGPMARYGREGSRPEAVDEAGEPLGDSIYSAFVLQEAARLVERPEGRARENALFIGLGTGTSVSAFMQHNVTATIVEIDANVYDAATRFFALPEAEPGKLFFKDARSWVRQRKMELERAAEARDGEDGEENQELYDIVVHDVFSGGGLPAHLFTQQFWNDTKALMTPDGVIAVNFVGPLGSESARAIILTLDTVFGQCRAFCDSMMQLSEEQLQRELLNWVFFCSPSTQPLQFRPATQSDYLSSQLRAQVLSTLLQRETDLKPIVENISDKKRRNFFLTDDKVNPLVKWQEKEALHHWSVMREVLPDVFWETY